MHIKYTFSTMQMPRARRVRRAYRAHTNWGHTRERVYGDSADGSIVARPCPCSVVRDVARAAPRTLLHTLDEPALARVFARLARVRSVALRGTAYHRHVHAILLESGRLALATRRAAGVYARSWSVDGVRDVALRTLSVAGLELGDAGLELSYVTRAGELVCGLVDRDARCMAYTIATTMEACEQLAGADKFVHVLASCDRVCAGTADGRVLVLGNYTDPRVLRGVREMAATLDGAVLVRLGATWVDVETLVCRAPSSARVCALGDAGV